MTGQQLNTKNFLDFKATVIGSDDTLGIIEKIVSVFDVEDYGRDVMERGCFKDSLKRKLPKGVWMHDGAQPIAKTLEARELAPNDPLLPEKIKQFGGLYIKGQYNLETQRGREAYSDIKFGAVDEFSIGFLADKETSRIVKNVRYIKKAMLVEWSPVLMGMNPMTQVLSVKDGSMKLEIKGEYLGEYVERRAAMSAVECVTNALYYRIYAAVFDYSNENKTIDEKMEIVEGASAEAGVLIPQIVRSILEMAEPGEMETAGRELKELFVDPALLLSSVNPRTGVTLKAQAETAHTVVTALIARFKNIAEWKAADRATDRAFVLSEANRQSLQLQVDAMKVATVEAEKLLSETAPIDTSKPDPAAMQMHLKMLAMRVGLNAE